MKKKYLTCLAMVTISGFTLINAQSKNSVTKDSIKSKDIEEIVIVGFGKQKKGDLTNAVSVISEKALEGRPVNNVVDALQGVAPGLSFNLGNGGGQLNNQTEISLRGSGTLSDGATSSAPLVLIDGVAGNPSLLNPRDIASVSILKDAAAASIYGSRAAFGVILITTKSGRKGKTSVSYDIIQRYSTPILMPKMVDSETFAYYLNDAQTNAGGQPAFPDEILKKIKDYKNGKLPHATQWDPSRNGGQGGWSEYRGSWANNDWFKIFYREWVPSTEHNVSVRGGGEKSTFYFSANYLDQEGLLRFNTDHLNRYTINGKLKVNILPTLNLQYNSRFIRRDYKQSAYMGGLFFHNIARRWPTLPVKDPNGNYFPENEIAELNNSFRKNQHDILDQQLALVFSPVRNWDTHLELNYKIENSTTTTQYNPIYRYGKNGEPIPTNYRLGAGWDTNGGSALGESASKVGFFSVNLYSTYSKTLNEVHNFKIMAGMQSELYKYRNVYAERNELLSTELDAIAITSGDFDNVGGGAGHWSTYGVFSRFNYDYDRKYLLEFNTRLDASSRFLRDQRWRWYPSISIGWNVARENFWKDGILGSKIKDFKFRASYGSLGNQHWKNNYYPFFLKQPIGIQNGRWLINGKYTNTASAPGLISDNLTWETIQTLNFGFDLTAFNNRLTGKIDYFIRNTLNMVADAPELPGVLGIKPPKFNNADLRTKGFEVQVSWRDRIGQDFRYGVSAMVSDAQGVITRYDNETKFLGRHYVGQKLGEIWGYVTEGIAKTDEEMTAWLKNNNQDAFGRNWAAGDIMYKDLNGDGVVNQGANTLAEHGDLQLIGNSTKRYEFGINLDMQYKGFDLSMLFQGVGKREIDLGNQVYFTGANGGMWQSAAFVQHMDYFRANEKHPLGANINSYYPRVSADGGKNFATQTRWLQNGAYIRLKNIQFGYTLPKDMVDNLGISNIRFYLTGENLVTWTKLSKIFDPETIDGAWGRGKIYPLSKVVAAGISVNF